MITEFLVVLSLITIFSYLIPVLLAAFYWKPENLKDKYNAKWALVTGGSSGIGRALCEKLAKQGLNVVIVAIEDNLLTNTHKELTAAYPKQQFRAVGVNLGKHDDNYDYLAVIAKATEDIDVQCIFNNAGYLIMKGYVRGTLDSFMTNWECNATASLRITHHFMKKMVDKKLKGCVTFTSSTAAYFPAPASAIYAASKASLAAFASCLSIEGKPHGIDVLCLNSGPMKTRFYDTLPKLDLLSFFHAISDTPETVADVMLTSVGRLTWRDSSIWALFNRLIIKVLDINLLCNVIAWGQQFTSDFKKHPDLT